MQEEDVRERAQALCTALVSGDVGQATVDFSSELRQKLGEVLVLLPLPSTEATIDSIEHGGGAGYTVVLRLTGETEEVMIQTRWKERGDRPTLVELSHLSKTAIAAESREAEGAADGVAEETT
jgi:hypothetical protein